MIKLKFIYIFILLISTTYSEQKAWTTTTFEYYWNLTFNQIRFREPVNFTPFETKIGYMTYGGSDYWDNLISTNLGEISPVLLDSTNNSFDYLKNNTDRILVFLEFDFLKFNFPNIIFNQNFIDIQTGIGYRYIHSISEPSLPQYWENTVPDDQNAGTFLFKPRIHDFNINNSIDYQPLQNIRAYLYHSIGYAFGTIYEYDGTGNYLKCKGLSEGFGVGIRYINKLEKYDFNLIYNLEFRLHRNKINKIEDPSKISHIIGLDMYSKGLIFSIGTIFGGEKTSADHSFLRMLNQNYITAEPGFENYINNKENPPRKKLAKKMLEFTKTQIPYEQYTNGLKYQSIGNIDSAIYWFNLSEKGANKELSFEIQAHKKDLAIALIDSVSIYKRTLTFDNAEHIILKAKKLIDDYYYVNEMLSDLYIEKGDAFEKSGNYNKAYIYYNKAKKTYPDSHIKLIEKYSILSKNLIKEGNEAITINNYPLGIESLEFALDINPDKEAELKPVINELYSKLSSEESNIIKSKIENIVKNKLNEIENLNKKILIGMSANEVKNAIGPPIIKDDIEQGGRNYQLWTYNNNNITRIYFEENLVIKIE